MKKNKTAALLAAAFLMYGGATVCAYDYANVQQYIGASAGATVSGTEETTYTDEVYADAKGTLNLSKVEIVTPQGELSAQGGTINITDGSHVHPVDIWAVRAPDDWDHMDTANYYGGQVNISDSTTDVSGIYVNGAGSSSTISGGTFKADSVYVTQTTYADDKPINDAGNTTGGQLTFTDGVKAELGAVNVLGPESQLTVSGAGTNVTAGSLTVKPESGEQGGKVEIADGTLTVNGNAALTNSTLTSSGTTTLNSLNAEKSAVTVSGGALTANGTVSMTGSTMTVTGGSVHFAKDWTATGGSTTVGNAGGTSLMAEEDALTVDGTAKLNDHDLTIESGNTVSQGALEATNGTEVTVKGTLNVTGNASLTDSTLISSGTTTLGSLTSKNSDILVDGGTFTVKGAVNTDHFKVTSGEVNFNNGGTMTGKVGVKDDGSDGVSALYIDGEATVNATNVTFTGGEVAVDDGGTLNLTGGTVDVPVDYFTTKGGTITTDGTTIKSGVWAHDANGKNGTVTLNNSTLTGGSIGAQDSSEITMNGGTADVDNVVLENGSTITFNNGTDNKGAVVTAGAITASGTGTNILNIRGGSQVTADSLTATESNISITGSGSADDSHLTINGDTVLSEGSKVTMDKAANATFNGTVDIKDATSGITFTGENTSATFASGSKLYAEHANSAAPAVTVSDKATLTFAAGSSVYTTASDQQAGEKYIVNTVAAANGNGQITVNEGASLYITNLDSSRKYSLDQVVIGNNTDEDNGWNGNAYGSSMLQVVDKTTGAVDNRDFDTAYNGTVLAGAVYDAVIKGGQNSAAYKFTDAVIQGQAGASDASEIARISNALNSHSGMTGLAGAGYGTYRFTTAFTDAAANHEEGDLWASYLHDKSSVDGLSVGSLRADYDLTYDGAVIGSDFYRSGDTTIGAAFAYADGDISTKSGVYTKNDVDYYGGMIYGSMKGAAGMTYRAEIGYNRSSNDITQVNTGSRITGSVDADAFHVGVSAEKAIQTGTGVWTPFVGLQYIDLSLDDYSDSLGFRHEGDSAGLWNMPIGVNYKYEMANGSWTYAPTVTLGYRFAFGDDSLNETFSYNGVGSTFGTEIAEDSFFTRIGFEAKKDNLGFGVHYGYERGSNTEANQWGIDCSFYF